MSARISSSCQYAQMILPVSEFSLAIRYVKVLTAASAKSITQVSLTEFRMRFSFKVKHCQIPLAWTSFKPPWGFGCDSSCSYFISRRGRIQFNDFSASSRPASRNQMRIPTPSQSRPGETSLESPPLTGRTASPNAIRPKTGTSIRSNRSPTLSCSKGTYVPGSVPSKPSRCVSLSSVDFFANSRNVQETPQQ